MCLRTRQRKDKTAQVPLCGFGGGVQCISFHADRLRTTAVVNDRDASRLQNNVREATSRSQSGARSPLKCLLLEQMTSTRGVYEAKLGGSDYCSQHYGER
jgi:hypothetical protein